MRLFAYIRKRLRWFFGGVFILILGCLGLLWFLVHYRLKESIRLFVATESKGRFAFEAGEAKVSYATRSLRLRDVLLHTTDTTGAGTVCDIRIPEIYLSLASWKALMADNKLLVDSLAIQTSLIRVRTGVGNGGAGRKPFALDDARAALDSVLHRLNVRVFSLHSGEVRIEGADSGSNFRARGMDIQMKDFVRGAGKDLRFVSSHQFALVVSTLDWTGPGGIQRLTIGKTSFDTHSQRFEADSVAFQQLSESAEPYRLTADRCYFRSKELADVVLRNQAFLLDTLVCINPTLRQPQSQAMRAPQSRGAGTKPVYIGVRYVGVVNGRAVMEGKNGGRPNFSARRANCSIYGLSIDANRKFPIHTDSVRVRLDKLMFTTRDERYALTIDDLRLEGEDAVFQGVHYGPVRDSGRGGTSFNAPLLRLRNVDVQRLLEGHLHATGAELVSPKVVTIQTRSVLSASPDVATRRRKIMLFYHTLHNLKEIIDAGALDISDGQIHFVREGEQLIDATGTGLKAHILLNGILASEDLLDAKHAIIDAGVDELRADIGGNKLRITGYRITGNQRHSGEKEVEIVLKSGWSFLGRHVAWANFDWDTLQRSGLARIDSVHMGRIEIHRNGSAVSVGQENLHTAITRGPALRLEISRLEVDTLNFEQVDAKQHLQFASGGLQLKGIRSAGNTIHWDGIMGMIRDLRWQNSTARVVAKRMQLDGKTGVTAYEVEGRGEVGKGRLEVSAPEVRFEIGILSTALPADGMVRVPKAMVHFDRDSLRLSAELGVTTHLAAFRPLRLEMLDLAWRNSWVNFETAGKSLRVTGLAGHLRADTLRLQSGQLPDWRGWLGLTTIDQATVKFDAPAIRAEIGSVGWDPGKRELRLTGAGIRPTISRDSFFGRSQWQGDYVTGTAGRIVVEGLWFKGDVKKPGVDVGSVQVEGAVVEASRNKNIPFHHGVEKGMPTKMLASLAMAVTVHRVDISGSQVVYNELSAVTGRWGRVTLNELAATIGPLTSRSGSGDTLALDASARLFDGHIRRFRYRESYGDPNSGFDARASFSPLDLTRLSEISSPAAAVNITGGRVDTAWAIWRGNRYAAYGYMGFKYRDLRIKVLDKKDSTHGGFLPAVETFAANLLLPGHSRRGSVIYFERDREKFVFNYWVKTQTSGIVSTVLQKKNAAYRRLYAERSQEFLLPPTGLSFGPW